MSERVSALRQAQGAHPASRMEAAGVEPASRGRSEYESTIIIRSGFTRRGPADRPSDELCSPFVSPCDREPLSGGYPAVGVLIHPQERRTERAANYAASAKLWSALKV